MYRVIRASSDYGVVVVVTPEDSEPKDPRAKYYLYNDNIHGRDKIVFHEVSEEEALSYFSGIADGMGFGDEGRDFESLEDVKGWMKKSRQEVLRQSNLKSTRYLQLLEQGLSEEEARLRLNKNSSCRVD